MTGGTAAELPGIAAELTGSFHRTADAGARCAPGPPPCLPPWNGTGCRSPSSAPPPQAKGRGAVRLHPLGRRHRTDQAAPRSRAKRRRPGSGSPPRGPRLGLCGRRGLPGRHRVRARCGVCRAGGALAAAGRSRAGEGLRP
ncbi:putative hydrolase [Streptomyces globisporus]|uniref:Hydrolase n=1 Tax=Streptomyces globisporus TaxID=1908 RepID=A0ABM9GTE4_STRGL|nr:putative hydrolase [Streptomyces globisporus]